MGTSITIPGTVEERLSKRASTERQLSGTAQVATSKQTSSPVTQRQFKIQEEISFSLNNQKHFQQSASPSKPNQFDNIILEEVEDIGKSEILISKIEEDILKSLPINSINSKKELQRLINGHTQREQLRKINEQNYSIFANLSDEAKEHFKKVSQKRMKTLKNKISCTETIKLEDISFINDSSESKTKTIPLMQIQEPPQKRQDKLFLNKKKQENEKDKRKVENNEDKASGPLLIRIDDLENQSIKHLQQSYDSSQAKNAIKERNMSAKYPKSIQNHQICNRRAEIRF